MKNKNILFYVLSLLFVVSCTKDSKNMDDSDTPTPLNLTDEVEVYESDLVNNDLVLAVENGGTTAYLLDKEGHKKFTWNFDSNLGNDLELLPDGRVIGIFKDENPEITFGGYGGIIKIINPDGSIDWEYEYSSANYITHHDVELLPNGNVLMVAWEKIETNAAIQAGADTDHILYPEKLIEVNPNTDEIVWEWHSWDHIIQDFDNTKDNYGSVSENPQRININYGRTSEGLVMDIMHINGMDYDETKDVIYLSVNAYSEIWVIDHSTTTQEAETSLGGNYNKGGDLLYRFGNPSTYNNTFGTRLFHKVHFPNLIENNVPGMGHMLVFSNGVDIEQSSAIELELPEAFSLLPNTNNEPVVVWEFTDPDMFSTIVGSSVRLSNGNTLISESDYGYWEVTPNGEIAWKYNGIDDTRFWRGYAYNLDFEGLTFLGISF